MTALAGVRRTSTLARRVARLEQSGGPPEDEVLVVTLGPDGQRAVAIHRLTPGGPVPLPLDYPWQDGTVIRCYGPGLSLSGNQLGGALHGGRAFPGQSGPPRDPE